MCLSWEDWEILSEELTEGFLQETLQRVISTKLHGHHNVSFWFSIMTFSGSGVYIFQKAGKYEVLQPLESLGKRKSFGSQEVFERRSCKSPKTLSRSEDGELKFCLPEINQDDTSTTNAE